MRRAILARAKALLDEAGWVAGADGVRAKDGVTAAFDLYYSSSDSVRQAIAMEFANQMNELGIKVTPKGASWDDIYQHQFSDPVVWGWGSNSPIEVYNLNYSTGNGNYACYENAAVDAHLNAALANPVVADSYRRMEAGHVGRRKRPGAAGRCHVGVVRQRRPPVLRGRGPEGCRAEAASAWSRLVDREQRRQVELVAAG